MKVAEKFQEWIVDDELPKLRQYGKYTNDNKIIMSLLNDYENKYKKIMMKYIIQI